MRRRLVGALLALSLGLLACAAPPAQAASTRRLCAKSATLRDSPEGFIIGRLYRPQRLRYYRRSANRRWAYVRARTGAVGWVLHRSLCRA